MHSRVQLWSDDRGIRTRLILKHVQEFSILYSCEVIQMLMDFKDYIWVSMRRKCNTHSTCMCRSPTEGTDTIQWRCHNCSHGKRAMKNITRYRAKVWSLSTEHPRSTAGLDKCHFLWKARSFSDDCPLHLLLVYLRSANVSITHLAPFDGDAYL